MEINKTQRLLQLLMLLAGKRSYSVHELKEKYQCSERSIYRDLDTLEQAGFLVERNQGRYRLQPTESIAATLQKVFHFEQEEAAILYEALNQIDGTSEIKTRLVKKLHTFYDLKILEEIKQKDDLNKIQVIADAVKKQKQIQLFNYHSSNSGEISTRRVEAFEFSPNYRYIWAYEIESKACKQFKVSRIEKVETTAMSWSYPHEHQKKFVDIFKMASNHALDKIHLNMSLRAYNLLKEEFPAGVEYVKKISDSEYELIVDIADYKGVGRFVLGLLNEIKVVGSEEFRNYIRDCLQNFTHKMKEA